MVCSRYPKEFKYYEITLKRKCFQKLRNNVWENKTKWILLKKADSHYRMKVLGNCINLWVAYLNGRYKKRINYGIAVTFYEEKLKTRALLILRRCVERNWLMLKICRNRFEWNLKYWCWHQWKHYIQKRLKVKEIKLLADRIRDERLILGLFYLWLFRLNEKRSLQDAYKAAVLNYETKLEAKHFKSWKVFTEKQICKLKIKRLALSCYEDKLKEKYIRCWKRHVLKKKHYNYQMVMIQNFYENYLLKNYLSQWFAICKEFKLKKKIAKTNLAITFYETNLLKRSLLILWKTRETKKVREEKTQKFREIHVKVYLNFYINLWKEKWTEKILMNLLENKAIKWRKHYLREYYFSKLLEKYQERIEEKEEIEKIIKYSQAIIVHRAFRGWCEVTERKMNKKILLENAQKFYFESLTKKSFEKLKRFVNRRSRKKMASEYCRYVLLSQVMTQWKIFVAERKQKFANAWNMEQKRNAKLLRGSFDIWKDDVMSSKSKLYAAIDFYYKSKLSKAFHGWKKNIQINTVSKSRYNLNKNILNDVIIKNAILRWYEVHSLKQHMKKKLREFKLRQEKRCLKSYFDCWHEFVEKMKCIKHDMEVYSVLRSNILIEQYLFTVLDAVNCKKILKRKEELAKKTDEKMLKRRYMKRWLSFVCWKKERILRCVSKDRKFDSKEAAEIYIPVGKSSRRKPMIPSYLKVDLTLDHFEEEHLVNQETFRVEEPVNKNLPVIGQNFASFEL